ncbi:Forkhead-associated (FHA) domain [Trypanosoma melophagium]|uniref:Forkhead-associated (FHA) domain n=1 Tax=Trypanosoma melophagium TaxID=715481 RepID=UPI00351A0A2E|nr:Forkhead-associated (FHA) domain [Trypanosoma melophagium]
MVSSGKWILERSDGFIVEMNEPGVSVFFGRDKKLPQTQQMDDKYISRHHFVVNFKPPALFIKQLGKNPTFYSKEFLQLPGSDTNNGSLEFRPSCDNNTEKVDNAGVSEKNNIVLVPSEVKREHQSLSGGNEKEIGQCTLHFPEELRLPHFTVRYVVSNSNKNEANTTTHANIPMVPLNYHNNSEDEEEDEKESEGKLAAARGCRGILDAVLHEQEQKEKEKKENQEKNKEEESEDHNNNQNYREEKVEREKKIPRIN